MLVQDGEVKVAGVEVGGVLGQLEAVVAVGDGDEEVGLVELGTLLEGEEVPDLLEGLSVALLVGGGLVEVQPQENVREYW